MSAGEYAGLKIGMSKGEAFKSYCGGEAGRYLKDLMFLDEHYDMVFVENGRVCDSVAVMTKSDILSADRTNNIVGGNVTILFEAGKVFHITYSYSPLAV